MLDYHFTIAFYLDGWKWIRHTLYTVAESSCSNAWEKAMNHAIKEYGDRLCMVELHSIATY